MPIFRWGHHWDALGDLEREVDEGVARVVGRDHDATGRRDRLAEQGVRDAGAGATVREEHERPAAVGRRRIEGAGGAAAPVRAAACFPRMMNRVKLFVLSWIRLRMVFRP